MKRRILFGIAIALLFAALCLPVIGADKYADPSVTVAPEKNGSTITIKASFDRDFETEHAGEDLYLFAIRPYQSASLLSDYSFETSVKVAKDVEISVPTDSSGDFLYCKFLLALRTSSGEYESVTAAKYVDNPEALAEVKYDYPEKLSKKGLHVQMTADAQILGVSHATVNVEIGEFIIGSTKPSGSVSAVQHKIGNKIVYFSAAKIEALDKRVKEMTDAGINVFLHIINTPYNSDKMSPEVASIYFVGSSTTASMYALNIKDRDCVLYMRALLEFLAERYTREDREYGFAGSFIIGYEVNSNRIFNSAGPMLLDTYLYTYTALLRIADTAMRSQYANGRVYVPLSNKWTAGEGDDELLDYPAYKFISSMNRIIKQGGDIPWNLSLSGYASSITSISSVWTDPEAVNSIDSPYMTMKNIDVACDFVSTADMQYKGKTRDIIIGEFGVSGNPGSESELANQAASYAFAYYKAAARNEISAIIYHRQVDSSLEAGLFFGLWTTRAGTIMLPMTQKPIYKVFRDIDITPPSEMTSSVLGMMGVDIWTSVVPGVDESAVNPRQLIKGTAMSESDIPDKKFTLKYTFKGNGGLAGFTAGENASDIYSLSVSNEEAVKVASLLDRKFSKKEAQEIEILELPLDNSSYADYMGTSKTLEPDLFKNAKSGYIRITGKAELSNASLGETVSVMIRLTYTIPAGTVNVSKETMNRADGQEIVYEGTAKITPNDWTNLTFDISEFLHLTGGKADSMKIWILPEESDPPEPRTCALMIAGIGILNVRGTSVILTILKVIGIIVISAVIITALLLAVLIVRAKIIREKRRRAHAARVAAARAARAKNAKIPPRRK